MSWTDAEILKFIAFVIPVFESNWADKLKIKVKYPKIRKTKD